MVPVAVVRVPPEHDAEVSTDIVVHGRQLTELMCPLASVVIFLIALGEQSKGPAVTGRLGLGIAAEPMVPPRMELMVISRQ